MFGEFPLKITSLLCLRCFALLSVCEMRNRITFGSNSRAIDNNQQNKSGFDRGRDVIRLAKKVKVFLDAVKMQNQVVAKRKKLIKPLHVLLIILIGARFGNEMLVCKIAFLLFGGSKDCDSPRGKSCSTFQQSLGSVVLSKSIYAKDCQQQL